MPRPEDLRKDVVESLGDALRECGVDDYLLVGDVIPPLIIGLAYTRALTEAFIDKYDEAVAEVRRVRDAARGKGSINLAERIYGLGLASIIANAAELNKDVESSSADTALHITSNAIRYVVSPDLITPILRALEPLRGKAPHRYLELLAPASDMENLDLITVRYIFDELNEILDNYGDVVRGYAWSLVHAIRAYANLLGGYFVYFSSGEIVGVVGKVVDLLKELGKFSSSLSVIAWAIALVSALRHKDVRELMEEALHIDVVDKEANEVLEELNDMRKRVQELMRDEEFMDYVESRSVKADEEAVKKVILMASSHLKHALARYRLHNDELKEAEGLFKDAAGERREIGDYKNYLINYSWVLRVKAIKGSLVGDELVNGFRQLYEEAFNEEHLRLTAEYLSTALTRLGEYLVSLALTGNNEEIRRIEELLKEHWQVLDANKQTSVLTRLMLNALLGHMVELSGKLKGKLSVNPGELINAFRSHMHSESLPALRVALGIAKPEDGATVCMLLDDSTKEMGCRYAISVAMNDNVAVVQFSGRLIDAFRELLSERLGLLKELGVNADKLTDEFMELVYGLDGKSLAQLIAPASSMAQLALMLHALINGNKELAKAHALYGAMNVGGKLLTRLFLEAYRACCDLESESFRRAIAGLFFFHV